VTTVPDQQLLSQIAGGDVHAFGQLYDRYSARLFGLIRTVIGTRDHAEDILQESFWQIWRSADRFDARIGCPLGWMILIARSRAIDHIRRRDSGIKASTMSADELAAIDWMEPDSPSMNTLRTRHALEALPREQRDSINLSFYRGLTHEQIARMQGVPLGTVKTRIRLGVRRLREWIERQDEVAAK
jgi:RNA polymerase sigma-70 factor, ECF subfamily